MARNLRNSEELELQRASKHEDKTKTSLFRPISIDTDNSASLRGFRCYDNRRLSDRIGSGPISIPQDRRFDIDMHELTTPEEFWELVKEKLTLSVHPQNIVSIIDSLRAGLFPAGDMKDRFNNCYAFTSSQISQFFCVFDNAFRVVKYDRDKIQMVCIKTFASPCTAGFSLDLDFENQMIYFKNPLKQQHMHTIDSTLEVCGVYKSADIEKTGSKYYIKRASRNLHDQGINNYFTRRLKETRANALPVKIKEDPDFNFVIGDQMAVKAFWEKVDSYSDDFGGRVSKNFITTLETLLFPENGGGESKPVFKFTVSQFCKFSSVFRDSFHFHKSASDRFFYLGCSNKLNRCKVKLNVSFSAEKQLVYVYNISTRSHAHNLHEFLELSGIHLG